MQTAAPEATPTAVVPIGMLSMIFLRVVFCLILPVVFWLIPFEVFVAPFFMFYYLRDFLVPVIAGLEHPLVDILFNGIKFWTLDELIMGFVFQKKFKYFITVHSCLLGFLCTPQVQMPCQIRAQAGRYALLQQANGKLCHYFTNAIQNLYRYLLYLSHNKQQYGTKINLARCLQHDQSVQQLTT